MILLINLLDILSTILFILILARFILPFLNVSPYHPVYQTIYNLTEPILAPVRRILPPMGGLDLSPILIFVGINILRRILFQLAV